MKTEETTEDCVDGYEQELKPDVLLPGKGQTITATALRMAELLGEQHLVFLRSGTPVIVNHGEDGVVTMDVLTPEVAPTLFESVANLKKHDSSGMCLEPAICSTSTARVILASMPFKSRLPIIEVITRSPVLTEFADGSLKQITGYNPEKRTLASGTPIDEPELDEAIRLINILLADFRFATPGDKSRAIAALLTEALVQGGLLGGRAPVDLGEADQSQTGKGYRNKLKFAIFNEKPKMITLRSRGVGSLEEAVATAMLKGHNCIVLDNVRGKVDSPMIESALTEDTANARVPYSGNIEVRTDRLSFMMTSNRAELTDDLANRTSCVRIRKQPSGYVYQTFSEGDLLDHVRANRQRYLGAIFAVIRAWHAKGMPKTNEFRHDFRAWAQRLDWIVQHIFGEAPLLSGHAEVRDRLASPNAAWIRDVAFAIEENGALGTPMRAGDLVDVLVDHGSIEIPGIAVGDEVANEMVRRKANQAIGGRLARFFTDSDHRTIDGIEVVRTSMKDDSYRDVFVYNFSRFDEGQYGDTSQQVPV